MLSIKSFCKNVYVNQVSWEQLSTFVCVLGILEGINKHGRHQLK